jgi:hypothetical protein
LFPSWVIIKNHWAKYIICMYGNVMMKPLTMYNLIYANKNSKPKAVIAFSQEIRYTKRFLCIHNSSCYTSILWIRNLGKVDWSLFTVYHSKSCIWVMGLFSSGLFVCPLARQDCIPLLIRTRTVTFHQASLKGTLCLALPLVFQISFHFFWPKILAQKHGCIKSFEYDADLALFALDFKDGSGTPMCFCLPSASDPNSHPMHTSLRFGRLLCCLWC